MDDFVVPHDITREFLFHLPPKDMIKYCMTHKEKLALCSDQPFLNNYVYNNFDGLDFSKLSYPGTDWEKFLLIDGLNRKILTWDGNDLTVEYPRHVYQGEEKFSLTPFYRSPSLEGAFSAVNRTHSPQLLEYALGLWRQHTMYGSKVPETRLVQLQQFGHKIQNQHGSVQKIEKDLLGYVYADNLRYNDKSVADIILKYSHLEETDVLINIYRNAITTGDLNLVEKLLTPRFDSRIKDFRFAVRMNKGDIALAEQYGQHEIAEYLRTWYPVS